MVARARRPVFSEIPPRARRRALSKLCHSSSRGNTSACAEKRVARLGTRPSCGKYLRVRGEECVPFSRSPPTRKYLRVRGEEGDRAPRVRTEYEIPPRARRRGSITPPSVSPIGNTSACAEKSACQSQSPTQTGKYLRVRGEESFGKLVAVFWTEIPPRARRRAEALGKGWDWVGNTSACAEKRRSAKAAIVG